MFRLTGGQFKGKKLTLPPEKLTRPTSTRAREALFNILFSMGIDLRETTFLDGFAGSGAVGLEALSRGAKFVTFVENDRTIQKILEQNIKLLPFTNYEALKRFQDVVFPMDIVFLDPPYGFMIENEPAYIHVLSSLEKYIKEDSIVIVETSVKEDVIVEGYITESVKAYGDSKFSFLRRGFLA